MSYKKTYSSRFSEFDACYNNMDWAVEQIALGQSRSLVAKGPGGVGKTYNIEASLVQHAGDAWIKINNKSSALDLYMELYRFREQGCVVFLDDADSIYNDTDGINLLKAAMDSIPVRTLNWHTKTHFLAAAQVPTSFVFNGGVIIATNVGYDNQNPRMLKKLSALDTRGYQSILARPTIDDEMAMVCYMVYAKGMLDSRNLSTGEVTMLLDWVDNNKMSKAVNLRALDTLCNIYTADKQNWQARAEGLLPQRSGGAK
jgi:hypothetical protein